MESARRPAEQQLPEQLQRGCSMTASACRPSAQPGQAAAVATGVLDDGERAPPRAPLLSTVSSCQGCDGGECRDWGA